MAQNFFLKEYCKLANAMLPKDMQITVMHVDYNDGRPQYVVSVNLTDTEGNFSRSEEIFSLDFAEDFMPKFIKWHEKFHRKLNALHSEHFSQIVIHG